MNIKSSQTLVEEAKKSIKTLNSEEVKQLIEKNEICKNLYNLLIRQ